MKGKTKFGLSILLCACIMVGVLPVLTITSLAIGRTGYELENIDDYVGQVIVDLNAVCSTPSHINDNYKPYQVRYVNGGKQCVGFAWARIEEKLGIITFNTVTNYAKEIPEYAPDGSERTSVYGEEYTIRVYKNASEIENKLMSNSLACFEYTDGKGRKEGHIVYVEEVISIGSEKYVYYTEGGSGFYDAGTSGTLKKLRLDNFLTYSGRCKCTGIIVFEPVNTCEYDHSIKMQPDGTMTYSTIQKADGTYAAVCKKCGYEYPITLDKSSAGVYKVTETIILNSEPYGEAETGKKATKNTEYTVIGSTVNAYGNVWYQTDEGYWIFQKYITYVSDIPIPSIAEGTYYIEAYCGKVVEVADSKTGNKANVQIWDKSSRDLGCQKFNITKSGDYYTFTAVHSGKVIDIADGSSKSGTNIWQYTANGTDAQKWQFEDAGDGYYYIRSALGTYMDVYDNGTANGTNVWAYRFNGSNAQKFRLVNVSGSIQPHTLTIKYNTNGGSISSNTYSAAPSGMVQKGGSDVTAAWPYGYGHENGLYNASTFGLTREGYSFVGWSLSKDGSTRIFGQDDATLKAETIYPQLESGDATVTLYAIWERKHGIVGEFVESVSAMVNGSTVTVHWMSFPNASSYYVRISDDNRVIYESGVITGTVNEYSFTNVANGQYVATVELIAPGVNAAGLSEYFIVDSFHTQGIHFMRTTAYSQGQFTDVPASQWFTRSVADAFELGLMKGDSATTFNPYGDVTLAEAITMASRIHSIYYTGTENFNQGSGGAWYQTYLDYAYNNGIIDDSYYNTDVTVKATRAQFAEVLSNSLPDEALPAINVVADNAIPDVKMTDSFAQFVYRLYRAGILTGGDINGTFSPLTFITRAEAAAIVSRMVESDNRVEFVL